MPTALSSLYCTSTDVKALLSNDGVNLRLDDNNDNRVSSTENTRLTSWAINYATSIINDHALPRYDASVLASNWTVNWWAVVIAARFLCIRRLNPSNKLIEQLYKEVMQALQSMKEGVYTLGDELERVSSAPAWSNVRVPPWYRVHQVRVERAISEKTPSRVQPALDWASEIIGDVEKGY